MIVRPLAAHEIAIFAHVCGRDIHAHDVESYLHSMLQKGAMRLEWCFVAEEADQIIGTIAYWTLPSIGKPLDIVLFSLPWERDDVFMLGKQLLQETIFEIQHSHGGEAIGHVLDTPAIKPQWQVFPEQRIDLLTQTGFQHRRSTFRFKWQGETAPIVPSRLLFRALPEVGELAFIAAIEQVSKGTLDQLIQDDIERQGSEPQALAFFKEMQQMEYDPAWWHLAYNQESELVGLIMPGHSLTAAVIDYIGVLPAFRGCGYVDDLLARGMASLFQAGFTTVIADTDLANVPMANAFRRANYQQFAIRHAFEFPAGV